ncbi:MAG: site-2 protease family protein [Bryobacteraceae bacterium]
MAEQGLTPPLVPAAVGREETQAAKWPRLWWVNVLLLAITFATTTAYGAAISGCFYAGRPFTSDQIWEGYVLMAQGNPLIWQGLMFSIPLLLILGAHELGHYVACQRWRVKATLPFFLPSPLLLGTFGAFIRIKSPIYRRDSLFDIGVAGPVAGFLVLLPVFALGMAWSKAIPHVAANGDFVFGTPLLIRAAEWIRFPSSSPADIVLHPFAQAAWGGLLATAINLLPIGQLDGGHILYALLGPGHRNLSRIFLLFLLPMGFFSISWLLWALILFLLGARHPLVYDNEALNPTRKSVAAAALIILVLSLSLTPVRLR